MSSIMDALKNGLSTCSHFLRQVTVEPIVLLYMLSTGLLLPCLQDLIFAKVCHAEYDWNVCHHINEPYNKDALSNVQALSVLMVQKSTIAMAVPAMLSGQLLGTISDCINRKHPLKGPLIGGLLAGIVYVVVSTEDVNASIEWILLASILTGLGGGFPGCMNTCASYISQKTPERVRTSRVGALECMSLIGMTTGHFLAAFLMPKCSRAEVFTVYLAVHAVCLLYIFGVVPNMVPGDGNVSRLTPAERMDRGVLFITYTKLRNSLGAVAKKRPQNRRMFIIMLLLIAFFIMVISVGQADILYYYLKDNPLHWTVSQYSSFSGGSLAASLFLLIGVFLPLSSRVNDCILLLCGLLSKIAGLLVLGLARSNIVYLYILLGAANSWCFPALRSALSKIVNTDESGRVLGVLGIIENCSTLLGTSIFAAVYPLIRGQESTKGLLWLVSAALLFIPCIFCIYLSRSISRLSSYDPVDEVEDSRSVEESISSLPSPSSVDTKKCTEHMDGIDVKQGLESPKDIKPLVERKQDSPQSPLVSGDSPDSPLVSGDSPESPLVSGDESGESVNIDSASSKVIFTPNEDLQN